MTPRERFLATFRDGVPYVPPYHEDLRDEILAGWPATEVCARVRLDRWELGNPPGIDLSPRPWPEHVIRDEADAAAWLRSHQLVDRGSLLPEVIEREPVRTWPLGLSLYRGLFQTFGVKDGDSLVDHAYFLADHGDLVEAMMAHLADFTETLVEPALAALDYDFLWLGEAIASHHGPVISPAMFRRFVLPFYRRMIALARRHGVPVVVWESFGQVTALLPDVLDAGADVLALRHAAGAGIDVLTLRERFGPQLGLIGGIDGRLLHESPAAMAAEVRRVVPPLLAGGRYLPMLDDRVREHVSAESFIAYREALQALLAESS